MSDDDKVTRRSLFARVSGLFIWVGAGAAETLAPPAETVTPVTELPYRAVPTCDVCGSHLHRGGGSGTPRDDVWWCPKCQRYSIRRVR